MIEKSIGKEKERREFWNKSAARELRKENKKLEAYRASQKN